MLWFRWFLGRMFLPSGIVATGEKADNYLTDPTKAAALMLMGKRAKLKECEVCDTSIVTIRKRRTICRKFSCYKTKMSKV